MDKFGAFAFPTDSNFYFWRWNSLEMVGLEQMSRSHSQFGPVEKGTLLTNREISAYRRAWWHQIGHVCCCIVQCYTYVIFCDKDSTCFATASLLMIERSKDLDLCLFKTDIFWCGILASRLALMESLCGLRLNVVSAKVPRAIPVVSKSSATKVSLQFRD